MISRVARAPALRRVNVAFLAFSVAEHATWLAVAVYALQRGGVTEVGLVAAAQLLPVVVLTPFSSYAGDRFRPQRALAAGYAVQCASMLATAWSMHVGHGVTTYVFAAVAATSTSFTRPVMGSLMPTVTHTPTDLVAANVVAGTIELIGNFVGPVLAGVLMVVGSPATVLAASAVLTGLSAVAVALLRGAADDRAAVPTGRAIVSQMAAGFATVHRSPVVRLLLVFVAGAGLLRGVADVAFTVVAADRLDGGGGAAGYLAVVYGLGGFAAVTGSTRLDTATRLTRPFLAAGVASGAALLAAAVATSYVSTTFAFALMGLGDAMLVLTATVMIQRIAPTEVLARIFGIVEGIQMGALALGSYVVSLLVSSLALGPALGVTAAAVSLVVLGAVAGLHRSGYEMPAVDQATVARLVADPVFAALPAPVIERLARDADRTTATAGTVIVSEGDHGDRYYLIVDGEVSFTIAGEPIRVLGAGSSFGEIALLRDVPRTATATAVDDVDLLSVDRDEFLTAVTGHPRSFGTATSVADTWLGPR